MVNVIFASGVIRTPARFMHSVINMRNSRFVKKILLSVWKGEIDKYKNLRNFLKKYNVIILELNEPTERTIGFIKHQMKSLEKALEKFKDEEFIFKTRCDLYIDPTFFDKLMQSTEIWGRVEEDEFSVFTHKIWVMYFELTKPFYFSDETFFGKKYDIKKLINYNNYGKFNIGSGITHIRRYIDPFIKKFPLLLEYLKFANEMASITTGHRYEMLEKQLQETFYLLIQYLFYKITLSNFYILYPKKDVTTVYFDQDKKIVPKLFKSNFSKKFENCYGGGQIFVFNDKIIKNLFNGRVECNDVPTFLLQLIKKRASYNDLLNIFYAKKQYILPEVVKKDFRPDYNLRKKIHLKKYYSHLNEISSSPLKIKEKKPIKSLFLSRVYNRFLNN